MPRRLMTSIVCLCFAALIASGAVAADKIERANVPGVVVDAEGKPVAGVEVRGFDRRDLQQTTTDQAGRFTVSFAADRIESALIMARDEPNTRIGFATVKRFNDPAHEGPLRIVLEPTESIDVEVVDADGNPVADALVGLPVTNPQLLESRTDERGRAKLLVNKIASVKSVYARLPGVGFDYRVIKSRRDPSFVPNWPDGTALRLQLAKSRTISLQLVDEENDPQPDVDVSIPWLKKPTEPEEIVANYLPDFQATSNAQGVVEIHGVPNWPGQIISLEPDNEKFARNPIRYEFDDTRTEPMLVQLERLVPFTVLVVAGTDGAVDGAIITGIYQIQSANDTLQLTTDTSGKASWHRQRQPMIIHASSADRKLAAIAEIGPDDKFAYMRLHPVTVATGRLIDSATDRPMPQQKISWGHTVKMGEGQAPYRQLFGKPVVTNDEGHFTLEGIVVGKRYQMLSQYRHNEGKNISLVNLGSFTSEHGERIDLGDVKFERED